MAKVPFSKLNLKKVQENVKILTFDGVDIEVKQYLPINDKLQFVVNVIGNAADGNRFYNPMKIEAFATLEILFMYTNLSFTDTQKKDLSKLFDICVSNGLAGAVMQTIPKNEVDGLLGLVYNSADNIYKQMNSVYGIIENLAQNQNDDAVSLNDVSEKLNNPENLNLLKEIVTKLV